VPTSLAVRSSATVIASGVTPVIVNFPLFDAFVKPNV
jgi:hypothetical protein